MVWLWLGTAVVVFGMARAMRQTMRAPALLRTNYADRLIPTAGGMAAVAGYAIGLGAASLVGISEASFASGAALGVFGFAAIGLFDDVVGSHSARGLRGHFRALWRGELTSGMTKLVVGVGIAALLSGFESGIGPRILAIIVIAGSANVANLLDLRPARAFKGAALVSVGLLIATRGNTFVASDLWFVAACAGLVVGEVREEFMLGDTGANALGAAVGVATVGACEGHTAHLVIAALCVLAVNVAGELVSFSAMIDRVPLLRAFDRFGQRQ